MGSDFNAREKGEKILSLVIFFSFKIEIIVFNDKKEIDKRDKRTGGGYLIKRGSI